MRNESRPLLTESLQDPGSDSMASGYITTDYNASYRDYGFDSSICKDVPLTNIINVFVGLSYFPATTATEPRLIEVIFCIEIYFLHIFLYFFCILVSMYNKVLKKYFLSRKI